MLNFFTAVAPFCSAYKFRKFIGAILFFVVFASAAININSAGNAEIAAFIESEGNKLLNIPSNSELTLNFQTAHDKHSRAGFLFFWGEREVSIKADYTLTLNNIDPVKGTIKADSSWFTGYCGMIECRNWPMPAHQRIEVQKALVTKMLRELSGRFHGVFVTETSAPPAASSAPADDEQPALESAPEEGAAENSAEN